MRSEPIKLTFADNPLSGIFPLTLNQERVLMAREVLRFQTNEVPPSAIVRVGLRLKGSVVTEKLKQSLAQLVRRHPALRVSFAPSPLIFATERAARLKRFVRTSLFDPGLYIQNVTEASTVELKKVDFSSMSDAEYESSLVQFLSEEDVRSFRDSEVPRLRATLLRRPMGDHVLIVHVDRAVCDGASLGIIRGELTLLLAEVGAEADKSDAISGISHPAFAAWQAQVMRTTYFDDALVYWRAQWARFARARITFEDLPFATRDAHAHDLSVATLNASFTLSECEQLRSFVRRSKTTLFVLFFAAFSVLLSKYSQRTAVAIWAQFSNRVKSGTLNAIGDFSNSHLLGLELSDNPSVIELLHDASTTVIDAFTHQELALPHLWHKLGCVPRFPDAIVALDFRTVPSIHSDTYTDAECLHVSPTALPSSTARRFSNLGVYVLDDLSQISIAVEYWTSRFPHTAIKRVADELKELVLFFMKAPETHVSMLTTPPPNSAPRDNSHMGDFVVFTSSAIPYVPTAAR